VLWLGSRTLEALKRSSVPERQENNEMDKVYRSKVDWWIGLLLTIVLVAMVGNGIGLLISPQPNASHARWVALVMFLMAAFTASLALSTCYTITSADLLVKAAFFRWRIPLNQIVEVFPTHNPLSSPALSLDRLRVNYKRPSGRAVWIMISPKFKDEFLNDLAQAAGLENDGDRLVRRS
jgi:hypothetical protein